MLKNYSDFLGEIFSRFQNDDFYIQIGLKESYKNFELLMEEFIPFHRFNAKNFERNRSIFLDRYGLGEDQTPKSFEDLSEKYNLHKNSCRIVVEKISRNLKRHCSGELLRGIRSFDS